MKHIKDTRPALLILVVLFLSTTITVAQDHGVRIAFVGNSITFGAGLPTPKTQSYPAQFGDLLAGIYGDTCEIGNFAVSGRTMLKNGDFPLWDEPEFEQALGFKPNIVVILLGTNDSKPQNWDDYGHEFHDDYIAMIDTFKQINPYTEFFVCYPPPAFEIVWDIRDSVIVHAVIPEADTIISETGAELIDFYTPLTDSVHLFPDYIHPGVEGSAVMAHMVLDRFTETDVIEQVEKGVAVFTDVDSDRQYITSKDSVGTLSWSTLNATSVFLDGSEVDPGGDQQVNHTVGTTHTLIAVGEAYNDTVVYEFILYSPELEKITLSASDLAVYTGDTVTITAFYTDQRGYPMNDTVIDLEWSVSMGTGSVYGSMDNAVFYSSSVAGSGRIQGSHMGVAKGIWVNVKERENTSDGPAFVLGEMEVYPNPFDDYLILSSRSEETGEGYIKMMDMQGKTCIHRKINQGESGQFHLDTNHLPEGMFIYEWCAGKTLTKGKLVKNRSSR